MNSNYSRSLKIQNYFENINPIELRGDKNKYGIYNCVYHIIKRVEIKDNHSYLYIGCGDGTILNKIKQIIPNCKIDGLDFSKTLIDKAKTLNPSSEFYLQDVKSIKLNKKYDKIFSFSLLQYLTIPEINKTNISLSKLFLKEKDSEIIHMSIPDVRLRNISGYINLSKRRLSVLIPFFQLYKLFKSSYKFSNDGSLYHHPLDIEKSSYKIFKYEVLPSDSYYRFDIKMKNKII